MGAKPTGSSGEAATQLSASNVAGGALIPACPCHSYCKLVGRTLYYSEREHGSACKGYVCGPPSTLPSTPPSIGAVDRAIDRALHSNVAHATRDTHRVRSSSSPASACG